MKFAQNIKYKEVQCMFCGEKREVVILPTNNDAFYCYCCSAMRQPIYLKKNEAIKII